jgi:hypothetical protein
MANKYREAMISNSKDRGEARELPTYEESFGGGLGIPISLSKNASLQQKTDDLVFGRRLSELGRRIFRIFSSLFN